MENVWTYDAIDYLLEENRKLRNEIERLTHQTCYEDDEGNIVSSEDVFP